MQGVTLDEWKKLSDVRVHTEQYLRRIRISRDLDVLVDKLCAGSSTGEVQLSSEREQETATLEQSSTFVSGNYSSGRHKELPEPQLPTTDIEHHEPHPENIVTSRQANTSDRTQIPRDQNTNERHLPPSGPGSDFATLATMHNLMMTYYEGGSLEEAERLAVEVIAL
jgi:hypothetical protein